MLYVPNRFGKYPHGIISMTYLEVKMAYGVLLIQLLSDNQQITIDRSALVNSLKTCKILKLQEVCSQMVNEKLLKRVLKPQKSDT